MAYEVANKFGTGESGELEIFFDEEMVINSCAPIISIEGNAVSVDFANSVEGNFGNFEEGEEILIHVSASPALLTEKLGKYAFAKITLSEGNRLTLSIDIESQFTNADLKNYFVQAITVPNFSNVKIYDGGKIIAPTYSPIKNCGGICAFRCSGVLEFCGGHIDLSDRGIPKLWANKLRPLTQIEESGEEDSDLLAGQENFQLKEKFLLNSGDGGAFIAAKKIIGNEKSRIGNPETHGKSLNRGARDSAYKPSKITNVGGSTIFLVCEDFENFSPLMIAKYRSTN